MVLGAHGTLFWKWCTCHPWGEVVLQWDVLPTSKRSKTITLLVVQWKQMFVIHDIYIYIYIYTLMMIFFFIKCFLLHPPSSWLFKLMMLCITDKWFTFLKYVTWKRFLRFHTMDGQIWCLNCTDNRLDGCSGEGLVFPATYVQMWSLKQKHQQQWDKLNSKSVWMSISIEDLVGFFCFLLM